MTGLLPLNYLAFADSTYPATEIQTLNLSNFSLPNSSHREQKKLFPLVLYCILTLSTASGFRPLGLSTLFWDDILYHINPGRGHHTGNWTQTLPVILSSFRLTP